MNGVELSYKYQATNCVHVQGKQAELGGPFVLNKRPEFYFPSLLVPA